MLIVSSLGFAEEAFKKHKPAYVLSILDEDEAMPPAFAGLAPENYVKLIGDCSRAEPPPGGGEARRCGKLLDVVERWHAEPEPKPNILIHCHQGVARSMAVAYILLCAIENRSCEREIAARLRKAAPHADPNPMLIAEADAALGREDRMIEAILDLHPSAGAVDTEEITLPICA